MTKIDFEKVEKAFEKGVLKIFIDRLIELAELQLDEQDSEQAKKSLDELRTKVLEALERDLKRLSKHDAQALEKMGINTTDVKQYIKNPGALTAEDWQKIKSIKQHVDQYKQDMLAAAEKNMEDDIVQKERVRQKNKRFNVRDGWLPLQ